MKTTKLIALLCLLGITGCTTLETTTVQITDSTVDDLIPLQNVSGYDPLYYIGSDADHHFFDRLTRDYWYRYRVPKSELELEAEYAREAGWVQVMWPGKLESLQVKTSS